MATAPRRARTIGSRSAAALVAMAAALLLAACSEQQIELLDRINATRAENGLTELYAHPAAMSKAQAWAETMATEGVLRHSDLSEGITGDWRRIGENVGFSSDIATVHQAFLDSAPHRANIVDAGFTHVGTGYAESADGRIWVVQVFVEY
ncbi:MAG: CAP domain-containing protein [Acidimicrobiales bacterium]